jgi:hypothetical protein
MSVTISSSERADLMIRKIILAYKQWMQIMKDSKEER